MAGLCDRKRFVFQIIPLGTQRDKFIYFNQDVEENNPAFPVIAFSNYAKDLYQLTRIISYGPCKTTCFGRLKLLESKFEVHKSLNEQREASAQKVTQFT